LSIGQYWSVKVSIGQGQRSVMVRPPDFDQS